MNPLDIQSEDDLKNIDLEDTPENAGELISREDQERVKILDGLARKIVDLFQDRASQRSLKEIEWVRARNLYDGSLLSGSDDLPDRPFTANPANTGRRRPEPNIVRIKCDTAIANSVAMQFGGGVEKNWDMFPPANSTSAEEAERCRLMEKEIETQLSASSYAQKARRGMENRIIMGTGIMKGPVNTGKQRIKYVREASGVWVPKVSQTFEPRVEEVSPWRVYPDMSVTDFSDSIDMVEMHPWSVVDMVQYVEHPGFDGHVIKQILYGDENNDPIKPNAYNDTLAKMTSAVWSRNPYLYKDRYTVLEYHGPVSYDELDKLGLKPTYASPTSEYYGEVWVCCGKVIRMELENIEGHYETPYAASVFKRDPSSVFGYGLPLLLQDAQQVVTQTYHMILDNAKLTSGTQVAMYKKYIQPIDGNWTVEPNKVWLLTDPSVSIENAIKFFTPQNVIGNIMPVLQLAMGFGDQESAVSGLASGMPSTELGESGTGQLMARNAATALLDFSNEDWDDQVTEKLIRRYYAWNMQYNDKETIKGDYIIDVKSSSEQKNKAMYVRDLERLSMEVNQNPTMADLVNMPELYKARLALMKFPSNRIINTPEQIKAAQQQRAQQPNPQMIELQIKMAQAETDRANANLKAKQLEFEVQQQQQREMWEHDEKMGSNQARMAEAEAQVLKARTEAQIEMMKLAAKDEQFRSKLSSDETFKQLGIQSQVFIESMRQQARERDSTLYEKEIDLADRTGEGV